jgi:hypothetical protein
VQQIDLFLIFTRPLDGLGVPYMVTGSVASMFYGVTRFTNDLDLVIHLSAVQAAAIVGAFPGDSFYCPPADIIQAEIRRPENGRFNLIHHETGFKADIYPVGDDGLAAWGLPRRHRIEMDPARGLWIAPPEYVIAKKLQYYRDGRSPKHLSDIRGMLDVSGEQMDHPSLAQWIRTLGLDDEWNNVGRPSQGVREQEGGQCIVP